MYFLQKMIFKFSLKNRKKKVIPKKKTKVCSCAAIIIFDLIKSIWFLILLKLLKNF